MKVLRVVFTLCALCAVFPHASLAECFAPFKDIATIPNAWNVTVADFNHDGVPDIAAVSPNSEGPKFIGNLNIMLGVGDGTFLPVVKYQAAFGALGLATGDFDNDGNLDVIVVGNPRDAGSDYGGANIFLGKGDGTFRKGSQALSKAPEMNAVVTGDFDGDGKLDAVIAPWLADKLMVVLGNGDGSMRGPFRIYPGSFRPENVVAADFNGDGKLDVAAINSLGNNSRRPISIFLGNGDGTFVFEGTFAVGAGVPLGAVTGDFNEDGRVDLAVSDVDGTGGASDVAVLLGRGDGTFQKATNYPVEGAVDIVAADFSGDGHLDLLTNYRLLSLLIGNGDGTFQPAVTSNNLPANSWHATAGDFNQDGRPDVVMAPTIGRAGVTVALNTGQCP